MKTLTKLRQAIFLFLMISGIALLHGCVVYRPYSFSPVTVPDIVKMSKEKVSSKEIINEIKKSHTAYSLKASEYSKLQQEGVADSVVDYMQKTHLNLVRRDQQMQDSYYWGPGYRDYWYGGYGGYGWPLGYWGSNWGPTIIFRGGHGNFHGGGGYYGGGGFHRGGRVR